jgi:hypothetical protein
MPHPQVFRAARGPLFAIQFHPAPKSDGAITERGVPEDDAFLPYANGECRWGAHVLLQLEMSGVGHQALMIIWLLAVDKHPAAEAGECN